ncbi:Tex-like N-terminal domain-containing protein [Jhaorihella thermophila]
MDTAARISRTIATEIGARPEQVGAAVKLLDEGATVPFVARYRKEATGGLDDGQLRTLSDRVVYLRELEARRETILNSIREQGKLTDDLARAIAGAETKAALEDLYLPYKPKRRTRAMIARENGLEPLVEAILADRHAEPEALAEGFVTEPVPTVKDALAGARDILVERLAEDADLLGRLRAFLQAQADLVSRVVAGQEQAGAKYSDYFDHREKWAKVPSHRALAMMRASNEGVVTLDITPDEDGVERAQAMIAARLEACGEGPGDRWLRQVAGWAWRVKLSLSMMIELMGELRARAQGRGDRGLCA